MMQVLRIEKKDAGMKEVHDDMSCVEEGSGGVEYESSSPL